MARLVLMMALIFTAFSCGGRGSDERVLLDFESDSELDSIAWKCHTLLSLADEHVTHGTRSLKLELYPSDYPGLIPGNKKTDWSAYNALCFDIFNPGERDRSITVRIDDKKDYPEYEDRYNRSFVVKAGMNHMRIPLASLVTSGTGRPLDTRKIYRFLIFMVRPVEKFVFYIDYVRLSREGGTGQ